MDSLRELYKIGCGPSSSHTIGPQNAAALFKGRYPEADSFQVVLYGSLALTGAGHGTEFAIRTVLPQAQIISDPFTAALPHPNTMLFTAFRAGKPLGSCRIFSVGGGSIQVEGEASTLPRNVYPQKDFAEIMACCAAENIGLAAFVRQTEGDGIFDYLRQVWQAMELSVEAGLAAEGVLPGGLGIARKAKYLYNLRCYNESSDTREDRVLCAFAYAVSEQNASGGVVVTAPTCGSAGVLPAVLFYMRHCKGFPEEEILQALAVAGIIGNIIKTNASVSGAECGCQAEIGSACSMAAAGLANLYGMRIEQIEYAAEVAMEHHLGLTCDPVKGLVQIPCIERNAVAAMRALNSVSIAHFLSDTRKISFDAVVATMYQTGLDLSQNYRETSQGGLAKLYE